MLSETQSISLSILRASVEKLGLHEIFYVEKLHFLWRIVAAMS